MMEEWSVPSHSPSLQWLHNCGFLSWLIWQIRSIVELHPAASTNKSCMLVSVLSWACLLDKAYWEIIILTDSRIRLKESTLLVCSNLAILFKSWFLYMPEILQTYYFALRILVNGSIFSYSQSHVGSLDQTIISFTLNCWHTLIFFHGIKLFGWLSFIFVFSPYLSLGQGDKRKWQ